MKRILLFLVFVPLVFLATFLTREADARTHVHVVKGTPAHDWTVKPRRMNPDCGNPRPCKRDLKGTRGADVFRGSPGMDWLNSGPGRDRLHGGLDMDQLYGGDSKDKLIGEEGHDHLFGGDGNDYLNAADGQNEPGNVEEVHGNQPKKGERGKDTCVIDADYEGAIVSNCAKLIILTTPEYSGTTPIFDTKKNKDAGIVKRTLPVGVHYGI